MQRIEKRIAVLFLIVTVWTISACTSHQKEQQSELTEQIVERTIQRALYPPFDTDVVKTTLKFNNVQIAKPRTAGQQKVWYFPDTTIVYPVQVNFIATYRTQEGPALPVSYDIHNISQEYIFYKDEFGKWGLKTVSGAEDRDVETKHK